MSGTLLDYPSIDAKDYKAEFKPAPICPSCFTKKVKPFQDKGLYLCNSCVAVFKPK